MLDLIPFDDATAQLPAAPGPLLKASAFQRAGKAAATQRAYASDARLFGEWCRQFGF